jgi:uncharacterized protein
MSIYRNTLAILAIAFCGSGNAVVVEDLFSASVVVQDQSPELRQSAIQQGLGEVFVKLTGSRSVLSDPSIRDLLPKAARYLAEFSYSEGLLPDSSGSDAENPAIMLLNVSFASAMLETVLRDQYLPIWPADRPEILLWLVMRTEEGYRFVVPDDGSGITEKFASALNRRGVPFITPLHDLQDRMAITSKQTWELSEGELHDASRRYGVDYWLVIRFDQPDDSGLESGQLRGAWFLGGDQSRLQGAISALSTRRFIDESVDQAVDQFTPRFTYRAGQLGKKIQLLVSDIYSYADFKAVITLLESLEMVLSTHVNRIERNQIYLEVVTESEPGILIGTLDKNKQFARVVDVDDGSDNTLYKFQWLDNDL